MKISSFIICLLLSGSLAGQAASAVPDSLPALPTTAVTFDSAFYDFGTVKQGAVIKRTFHFTNTGADSLRIADVKTTCGCTVPEWPKQAVPPGGNGTIKVEFNTADKVGRQLRVLRVVANTEPAETLLQMGGEIKVAKKKKPAGNK